MTRRNTTSRASSSRKAPEAPPLDLTILRIAAGTGDSVATAPDGRTVFLNDGVPGDRVRATVWEERPRFLRAHVDPASLPGRAEPACPHASTCGGCRFQGVASDEEWRWKTEAAFESMRRLGRGVEWPTPTSVRSPSTEGWRGRVRWTIAADGRPGYLRARSHDALAVSECRVLTPGLQSVLTLLRSLAPWPVGGQWFAEDIDAHVRLVWDGPAPHAEADARWRALGAAGLSVGIAGQGADDEIARPVRMVAGRDIVFRMQAGRPVEAPALGFSQAHSVLNEALVAAVVEACGPVDGEGSLLEAFAGSGNFTFALLNAGWHVHAVEGAGGAVEAARAATWPSDAVVWEAADLAVGLSPDAQSAWRNARVGVVDPPRTGLPPALVNDLQGPGPARLVYVSCDPPTLARDAALLATAGWQPTAVTWFDMFPRTHHVETLAVFERPR